MSRALRSWIITFWLPVICIGLWAMRFDRWRSPQVIDFYSNRKRSTYICTTLGLNVSMHTCMLVTEAKHIRCLYLLYVALFSQPVLHQWPASISSSSVDYTESSLFASTSVLLVNVVDYFCNSLQSSTLCWAKPIAHEQYIAYMWSEYTGMWSIASYTGYTYSYTLHTNVLLSLVLVNTVH